MEDSDRDSIFEELEADDDHQLADFRERRMQELMQQYHHFPISYT
jgi:hypothetical protein